MLGSFAEVYGSAAEIAGPFVSEKNSRNSQPVSLGLFAKILGSQASAEVFGYFVETIPLLHQREKIAIHSVFLYGS